MYGKRVDQNHSAIRDGLRAAGYPVFDVHALPGRLDLDVLSHTGRIVPIEVKMSGESLTKLEREYLDVWPGIVVYSLEDALRQLREIDAEI